MDTSTGHLVRDIEQVGEELRDLYTPVPPDLKRAARRKLAGQDEAHVNLKGRSKLAQWSRTERSKAKKRRRMAKAGRKAARKGRRNG